MKKTLFTIANDNPGSLFLLCVDTDALRARVLSLAAGLRAANDVDNGIRFVSCTVDRDAFRLMESDDIQLQDDDNEHLYHNDMVTIDYGLDSRRQSLQMVTINVSAVNIYFKLHYRDDNDVARQVETRTVDRKFFN